MSEQVERKILALLDTPDRSPYGNPIPGLAELGHKSNEAFRDGVISVAELVGETEGKHYSLARIGEPLQVFPEQLADMRQLGLVPGAKITADFGPTTVTVKSENAATGLVFSREMAAHLFVMA